VRSTNSGSRLGQVFLIVFIDLVGFSVLFPLVPQMLDHYLGLEGERSLLGGLVGALAKLAGTDERATFAVHALFGGVLGSLYSGLQFLFAPVWGALSDKLGRRPTLCVTLAGTALAYVVWVFAGSFALLVASRVLSGVMAGNISIASAVVGDTTSGKDRAKGMGMVGMAIGLGFILGPALGGVGSLFDPLARWPELARFGINPFSVPALLSLALATVNLVWVVRGFVETLPPERRGRPAPAAEGARTLHPFRALRTLRSPGLQRASLTYFLYLCSFSAVEFTLTFLTFERLAYDPRANMWMFVYVGLLMALVQGGAIRRLAPRFGERRLVLIGLCLPMPGFVLIGTTYSSAQLYLGLTFMALGSSLAMPSLSSLASRYAPAERQGLALGGLRSAGALARAVGPLLGGLFFWKLGSASPYVAGAAALVVPLLLAARLPPIADEAPAPTA
jgi:MFS family permease